MHEAKGKKFRTSETLSLSLMVVCSAAKGGTHGLGWGSGHGLKHWTPSICRETDVGTPMLHASRQALVLASAVDGVNEHTSSTGDF